MILGLKTVSSKPNGQQQTFPLVNCTRKSLL